MTTDRSQFATGKQLNFELFHLTLSHHSDRGHSQQRRCLAQSLQGIYCSKVQTKPKMSKRSLRDSASGDTSSQNRNLARASKQRKEDYSTRATRQSAREKAQNFIAQCKRHASFISLSPTCIRITTNGLSESFTKHCDSYLRPLATDHWYLSLKTVRLELYEISLSQMSSLPRVIDMFGALPNLDEFELDITPSWLNHGPGPSESKPLTVPWFENTDNAALFPKLKSLELRVEGLGQTLLLSKKLAGARRPAVRVHSHVRSIKGHRPHL